MMRFYPLHTLTILWLVASAQAEEINFTPVRSVREFEGIKFPQLEFAQGKQKITYEQPRGWTYAGNASRIKFTPPSVSQAFGEIGQTPLPAPQNFDEPTLKALQEQAVASLPSESGDVSIVATKKNPIMINQHETFEVVVAYQLYGERYQKSVLYTNVADTQLTFRFVARKVDFDKLHRAFRDSLCSLQWFEPASTRGPG
jgi:hypothetical protein